MTETPPNVRLALIGYGIMGQEIERLAPLEQCSVVERHTQRHPFSGSSSVGVDVAIDFTRPEAALENIRLVMEAGVPLVVGTTGWYAKIDEVRDLVARANGRLVYGANFSIGVNLFLDIVRHAARILASYHAYDAAIHELHHARKADSPSGTALTIASILIDELPRKASLLVDASHARIDPSALHVSSTRVGGIPGTHTVYFDSEADTIELTHRARGRAGFALGALAAARWIVDQPPGMYRFEEDVMSREA